MSKCQLALIVLTAASSLLFGCHAVNDFLEWPPATCQQFCGLVEASPSRGCRALTEETCQRSFQGKDDYVIPCAWRCGSCLADGAYLLSCPNLRSDCPAIVPTSCAELCGLADLGASSCT